MKGKERLPPPPPRREKKHRLSLERAVAVAIRAERHGINKPLADPLSNFPSIKEGTSPQEMEARLLELQADIIIREDLLAQGEVSQKNRERELSEHAALLEAHEKVLVSRAGAPSNQGTATSNQEREEGESEALKALREELNTQEQSLAEARKTMKEREAFIEQCENELVEKSMLLTEREARIEQKEEDSAADLSSQNIFNTPSEEPEASETRASA